LFRRHLPSHRGEATLPSAQHRRRLVLPSGRLGVVEPGALADLLLVDGDPIANLDLLADPDRSLLVIMKDGRIHKDSAPSKD
jgi:imidazolonepropionase-like amidohydrolase